MLHQGVKLLLMVLPLLVDTAEWNPECPLKPTGATAPANSKVRCTISGGCKVTCKRGYTFHFGERQIFYKCQDGRWHLEAGDPKYYKECRPFCKPACMNGGHCIAPNTCQCQEGWHGRACRRAPAGTVSCSPPCENGGFCIMTNTCECLEGYTGQTCHNAVKLVTTSTRPIEYSTSIIEQPVDIPANISDTTTTTITTTTEPTTTTTTEPTTSHVTTTETPTTTFTTSSTSTKRTTTVVDSISSITTPSPTITQVDSSVDTEIVPPTDSSMSSEIVTGDLLDVCEDTWPNFCDNGYKDSNCKAYPNDCKKTCGTCTPKNVLEANANSSSATNGHRSADYNHDESQLVVDTEDPASERLDAAEDMDYKQDNIDAKLQIDSSVKAGCSCSVPWMSQTSMIIVVMLLMK